MNVAKRPINLRMLSEGACTGIAVLPRDSQDL
jgi:hypothetical protein